MSKEFLALLVEAFPEATWPVIARGMREGIRIADDVRRSTPFLTTAVGGDQKGTLLLKFREDIARSLEEKPESGEGE